MPTFTPIPPSNRANLRWKLNDPEISGSPTFQYPGETVTYTYTVEGSNAPSTPTVVAYKDGSATAVTSTVFPSGAASASGQVITSQPATGMIAGSEYSIIITATIAGNTEKRKHVVICVDPAAT